MSGVAMLTDKKKNLKKNVDIRYKKITTFRKSPTLFSQLISY